MKISPSVPQGSKILLIGDSLAQGMARQFDETSRKNGYISKKYFVQGTRTDFWSSRVEEIIKRENPDLVIVSLGTNDSGLMDPERQRKHIVKIRESIINFGSLIMWILPPPLPASLSGKEKINKILSEEIPGWESFSPIEDLERSKDGIHMTPRGYSDWVLRIWEYLRIQGILS